MRPITTERLIELAESETFGLSNPGICLACGEEQEGCEPDARRYKCDSCGDAKVYGAAEAILMGAGS